MRLRCDKIMNEAIIKEGLKRAIKALFNNQPNIFEFTSETIQTEWNIAHHLANEIKKIFADHDCDLDVIKSNLERRRPDIIFHKRGTHEFNFLVIEVKRDGRLAEIEDDKEKIKLYWFGNRLKYQYGAVINIKNDKSYQVEAFENSKATYRPLPE